MVELTRRLRWMASGQLNETLRAQAVTLQELLMYLESRQTLHVDDYLYCQEKLRDVAEQLKRLGRSIKPR